VQSQLLYDERSVDELMRDELHDECFMDRCFESAIEIKKHITMVGRSFQPKKTKKSKNPIFWKPDPLRLSKHLQ